MNEKETKSKVVASEIDEESLKSLSVVPSFWQVLKREFKMDTLAIICLVILAIIFTTVIVGSIILDQDQVMRIDFKQKYAKPGEHGLILGADIGGR